MLELAERSGALVAMRSALGWRVGIAPYHFGSRPLGAVLPPPTLHESTLAAPHHPSCSTLSVFKRHIALTVDAWVGFSGPRLDEQVTIITDLMADVVGPRPRLGHNREWSK